MVLSVFDDWYSVRIVKYSQKTVKQQKMTIIVEYGNSKTTTLLHSAKCTCPLFQGRTGCGGRPSGWHDIVTCQRLVDFYCLCCYYGLPALLSQWLFCSLSYLTNKYAYLLALSSHVYTESAENTKPRKRRYLARPPSHVPGQWPQPVVRGQGWLYVSCVYMDVHVSGSRSLPYAATLSST